MFQYICGTVTTAIYPVAFGLLVERYDAATEITSKLVCGGDLLRVRSLITDRSVVRVN